MVMQSIYHRPDDISLSLLLALQIFLNYIVKLNAVTLSFKNWDLCLILCKETSGINSKLVSSYLATSVSHINTEAIKFNIFS